MADDNLNVTPIIQDKGLIGVANDICLLLSLAQSRCVYCPEYTIGRGSIQRVSYRKGKIFDRKVIKDSNLKNYLIDATKKLRSSQNWAKKTGFVPAAYFWAETLNHEPGDIGLLLTWIALEILANSYAKSAKLEPVWPKDEFREVKQTITQSLSQLGNVVTAQQKVHFEKKLPGLNRLPIRQKILEMDAAYSLRLLTEKLISDSKKARDKIMHEGNYGNINRSEMPRLFSELLKATQLALINLLCCDSYIDKE